QRIEREFRILKSELWLRPIYHWTDRLEIAHIALCVLTLLVKEILERELGKEIMVRILEKNT
ncbi:MAG: IS1634 family transposase, partial [Thermoplasmata archaeon]